jgi:hypothetical protein
MIKIVRNIFIVCGLLFFLCACGAKTVNLTYDANGGTLPEGCEKIQQVSKENSIANSNPKTTNFFTMKTSIWYLPYYYLI